jgi:hypothetical protein
MKGIGSIKLKDGAQRSYIDTKLMALAKRNSRSNGSSRKKSKREDFVICICNDDYPASLELHKVYPIVRDAAATKCNLIRVIDESGEDYLYPSEYFMAIRLPQSVKQVLARAS